MKRPLIDFFKNGQISTLYPPFEEDSNPEETVVSLKHSHPRDRILDIHTDTPSVRAGEQPTSSVFGISHLSTTGSPAHPPQAQVDFSQNPLISTQHRG